MTKFLALAGVAAMLAMGSAQAQTKIQIGCTATSDCASAMVAVDEGIFRKHGLDAEMVLIGINSNIPAAILSNSIQIGGPTSTVFLQAVDGGLDLVAVAGASVMNPSSNENIAAFVRNGVTIKEPRDFAGKKAHASSNCVGSAAICWSRRLESRHDPNLRHTGPATGLP